MYEDISDQLDMLLSQVPEDLQHNLYREINYYSSFPLSSRFVLKFVRHVVDGYKKQDK